MTYFGVLAIFVLPPLLVLAWLTWRELRWRDPLAYFVVGALVVVALLYTTPWDNYLVATGVWWYDPTLVTGVTLGWVPIEEYIFFILQTLLTGLWALWVQARTPRSETFGEQKKQVLGEQRKRALCEWGRWSFLTTSGKAFFGHPWRSGVLFIGGGLWCGALALWRIPWPPVTYLALILSWAMLPMMVQLLFGADILWADRSRLWIAIAPPTLYLWLVDFLAIRSGTWTLDPAQTLGLALGGVLAVEEMLFFLVTNVLIVFGVFLVLAEASHQRAWRMLAVGIGRAQG
jgi:putative membrane protein